MKFEVKVKDTEYDKTNDFLDKFTTESVEEYDKQMKKVPGFIKNKIPQFDTGYYYDKEKKSFLVWNTFPSPKLPRGIGFLNPFKSSIKEMEKNLSDFLKDNGIKGVDVKFIE